MFIGLKMFPIGISLNKLLLIKMECFESLRYRNLTKITKKSFIQCEKFDSFNLGLRYRYFDCRFECTWFSFWIQLKYSFSRIDVLFYEFVINKRISSFSNNRKVSASAAIFFFVSYKYILFIDVEYFSKEIQPELVF